MCAEAQGRTDIPTGIDAPNLDASGFLLQTRAATAPLRLRGCFNVTALASTAARRLPATAVWLLAVGAGAFLVFWIQPLLVKRLLPALGGAAAAWTTALVFFQGALLAGYALAHLLARTLSPSRQIAALALLWLAAALSLPPGGVLPFGETPGAADPVGWLLATLAVEIGPAFVATALVTPLASSWLARSDHPGRGDPYFLYSASNLGSLGALLAYPFVFEPVFSSHGQRLGYSVAFAALIVPLVLLARSASSERAGPSARALFRAPPRAGRVLALAAVPSALLVSVSAYLAADVASHPLLWVAPLALYLATFAVAFARAPLLPHRFARWSAFPALGAAVCLLAAGSQGVLGGAWTLPLHLLALFLIALYCHGALAVLRPPATDLTAFYLFVSLGGVAGGLCAAVLAPLLFDSVLEYPLALAAFALLLPWDARTGSPHARLFGLVPAWALPWALRVTLSVLIVVLFHRAATVASASLVAQERSFYGVYRIVDTRGPAEPAARLFYHGTTLHGGELVLPDGSREPRSTYFTPGSPLGEVVGAHAMLGPSARVGVVGLGAGSLACLAQPGDEYRFYEIDPLVEDLARAHFAALRDCAPKGGVVIGDGRLALAAEPAGSLDLIVLDAFSSGVIPVHLLTEEALRVYWKALTPEGFLLVHISSQRLALAPVVARLARELDLAGAIRFHLPDVHRYVESASHVAVLAPTPERLAALGLSARWKPLGGAGPDAELGPLWTDDFSSILPVVRWRGSDPR